MSWVSADIFRENIHDKIAAFYALDKLASDDNQTLPIAAPCCSPFRLIKKHIAFELYIRHVGKPST